MAETLTRRRATLAALGALTAIVLLGGGIAIGRAGAPDNDRPATTGHASAAPSAADIGFAQDMATHHDQAVLMAGVALTRGSAEVRGIAQNILTGQSQEVGLLRGWLRLWGEPGVAQHPMAWMSAGDMAQMNMAMPGMATPTQLDRLYAATGKRFDVLFLQLMVRHHEGGLLMAKAAEDRQVLPTTLLAAQSISSEQIEELGTMRAMLQAYGAQTLPPPS